MKHLFEKYSTSPACPLFQIAILISASCSAAWGATVITPGALDNAIAFEAEIGTIDNSFDNSLLGWEIDAGTAPAGTSSGSWVANTENETAAVPNNVLSFEIDFQKAGTYTLYYRVSFTTADFQDTRNDAGNNDSFHHENGPLGDAVTYTQINGIPGLTSSDWVWRSGGTNNITVGAPGVLEWSVTGREDGFLLDRFVLVHSDQGSVDDVFLNGLANTTVIPEPSSFFLTALALSGLVGFRRRS